MTKLVRDRALLLKYLETIIQKARSKAPAGIGKFTPPVFTTGGYVEMKTLKCLDDWKKESPEGAWDLMARRMLPGLIRSRDVRDVNKRGQKQDSMYQTDASISFQLQNSSEFRCCSPRAHWPKSDMVTARQSDINIFCDQVCDSNQDSDMHHACSPVESWSSNTTTTRH